MFRAITMCCVLAVSGCTYVPRGNYFKKGIAQYSGDGIIRDSSHRSLFFGSRGYVVELGKFDLGSPFEGHFRLVGLPIITGSSVSIYSDLEDDYPPVIDYVKKTFDAKLTVSMTDTSGNILITFSMGIDALRWKAPVHDRATLLPVPDGGTRSFVPREGETYLLNVSYSPDTSLKGTHGHIYLSSFCGGS